jgi:hypothetical protein
MRSSLLTAAIAVSLTTLSFTAAASAQDATPQQDAAPKKAMHHRHHAAKHAAVAPITPGMSNADLMAALAQRDSEIAELKSEMSGLASKVGEIEERTNAQSDVNVTTAQAVEKLQDDGKKVDTLNKLVNDTSIGGKAFIDISRVDMSKNHVKTASTGWGLDVKRGYLSVSHKFNDTWSGNLTTDFNYISADGETQLFIKKLYLQGKFSDALVFRAGAADTPWIPYVENLYGFRYVEKELLDRMSFGTSADWGLNLNGKADMVDYSVSTLNGGGFKNPSRTKRMDFEGRIGVQPIDNLTLAVGGYSGTLGKETQTVAAKHTASRFTALATYVDGSTRLGAEWFRAKNWGNVTTVAHDQADGYSLWGSIGLADTGTTAFARYDRIKPNKDTNPTLRDRYFNVGVEWPVYKGIKWSAVYKNEDLKDLHNDTKTDEFGVFGEVSF